MEGRTLHPRRDERGVVRFAESELPERKVRKARAAVGRAGGDAAKSNQQGELAARVFGALPKPSESASDTFLLCISNYKDQTYRQRLASVANTVGSESMAFDAAPTVAETHRIIPNSSIAGIVTKEEMIELYNSKFAKSTQPGRSIATV